ncbi:MAG TPA: NAD(P)/FAD-dependent oxidoreductase [Thermoanaerobaculia bacterium]|nr:NAD(P)/FAD-dependent oxidoreductase [Thermoanaerobaculia bacterium]
MRVDVVIVGAGIGGAVLALDLGRRGWRVALVERESTPPRIARPEVLWSPTPKALERYGIADAIRERASVKLEAIEIGGEKPWLRITRKDFDAAGVDAYSTNPSMTRQIIADAAVATGNVEIHRGIAIEELLRDGDRVVGVRGKSFEVEARLVVGDDGGNSIVRTQLGIPITLTPFPIDFVTAMIPQWELPPNRARVWIDAKGVRAYIPWPGNEGVLLIPLPPDAPMPEGGEFKRVARPFGHAPAYVANGAALIGDAVHPMTPAGGQGANASIWDALALANVADEALRANDVSRERLLAYERLRRPINEQSVAISRLARHAFRFAFLGPIALRAVETLGWPKRMVLRRFASQFGVR